MFTGIITDLGMLAEIRQNGGRAADTVFRIENHYDAETIAIGASIACDGCCLTVTKKAPGWFEVEVSQESLSCTTLEKWKKGDKINLERALKVGDELGGHIVSGHVDGTAKLLSLEPVGGSTKIELEVQENRLSRFIAEKGSVTLNGVSLTVNEVEGERFWVNIIAHTMQVTNFGLLEAGSLVNLEIDMLARYMARMLGK